MRVKRNNFLDKARFRPGNIPDRLSRHRLRREAYEITGMAGAHRDPDLAVGLEATDSRAVAGARIDNNERTACRVDLDARGRIDADRPGGRGPRGAPPGRGRRGRGGGGGGDG